MVLEKLLKNGTDIKTFVLTRGSMELRIPEPMEYFTFVKEYGEKMGAEGVKDYENIALLFKNFSPDEDIVAADITEIEELVQKVFLPVDTAVVFGWFMSLSGVMTEMVKSAMEAEDFRRRK